MTKEADGFYWTGKEKGPPEVLLTYGEKAELEAFIDSHEQLPELPIDKTQLMNRLRSFASTFHFAFGDASNRDLAIAMWCRALGDYPERAIKMALDEVTATYKGSPPLVPGLVIAAIEKYLKTPALNPKRNYKKALQAAVLFHDQRGKEEYIAEKEAETKANARSKAAFVASLDEKSQQRKLWEQNDQRRLEEEKKKDATQKKEQINKMKAVAKNLSDNKRAYELIKELEQITNSQIL